ncbi:MAG: cytochrome C, partial [Gammaproteobacteria bacterium]
MKRKPSVASMLFLSAALLGMSGAAFSDDDKPGFFSRMFGGGKAPGVAPVENPQYLEECGSCHFPYQPGLLPERSWAKLMAGLGNHFGESAELPAEDAKNLTDYLVKNAADHANYKRSKKIMKSLRSGDTPLRVSETPYFIKKHDGLSRKMVQDNPKVGSFSKCGVCHT